jgi:hypothetical protein
MEEVEQALASAATRRHHYVNLPVAAVRAAIAKPPKPPEVFVRRRMDGTVDVQDVAVCVGTDCTVYYPGNYGPASFTRDQVADTLGFVLVEAEEPYRPTPLRVLYRVVGSISFGLRFDEALERQDGRWDVEEAGSTGRFHRVDTSAVQGYHPSKQEAVAAFRAERVAELRDALTKLVGDEPCTRS